MSLFYLKRLFSPENANISGDQGGEQEQEDHATIASLVKYYCFRLVAKMSLARI